MNHLLPLLLLTVLSTPTTSSKEDFTKYLIRPSPEQAEVAVGRNGTIRPFYHCETTLKPPEHNTIETFQIDLDLPPEERWTQLVTKKKLQIFELINYVRNFTTQLIGKGFMKGVDVLFPYLTETLPAPYRRELEGISAALKMELGEVALYNLFYEFFSVCTSVVVQAEDGTIYHGRNLDFGLLLGWDSENRTWSATELLRPLVVQLDFVRKGEIVYRSISYAGYTGVLTAVKKGQFALSINERFRVNGGMVGIVEWIAGFRKQSWLGVLTRHVMESCQSYSCAQKWLSKPTLIAPVYFILSGSQPSEGCIITRGRSSSKITSLGSLQKHQNASWYIVQTNYDQWDTCPPYDDRNTPSMICMEQLGRSDVVRTLTNVLSTRPVLNKLTTYTALMSAQLDMLVAWIQNCQDPCWPW